MVRKIGWNDLKEHNACMISKIDKAEKEGAVEQKEKDEIDFIRLEVLPKSKKEQYRVFFKDKTEQVFPIESKGGETK